MWGEKMMEDGGLSRMSTDEVSTDTQLMHFYKRRYKRELGRHKYWMRMARRVDKKNRKLNKELKIAWHLHADALRLYYKIPSLIRWFF
jgi:hypothetical protein